MVPESQINLTQFETVTQPSLTYKLDLSAKRINGYVDDIEAVRQTVMKILDCERYAYVIYSSQYGVELEHLIGKDYDYILAEIERSIADALTADDRILGVSDFHVEKTGLDTLMTTFTVNSVFGRDRMEIEVQVL